MMTAHFLSMEPAINARFQRTTTKSIFHELDHRETFLAVARDQVVVLRPNDTQHAIGIQNIGSYCCFVLIGTTSRPAITTAKISTSDGEEHYMSSLRLMIGIFMKEQESFQLPRVWGIFSHGQKARAAITLQDVTPYLYHIDNWTATLTLTSRTCYMSYCRTM